MGLFFIFIKRKPSQSSMLRGGLKYAQMVSLAPYGIGSSAFNYCLLTLK